MMLFIGTGMDRWGAINYWFPPPTHIRHQNTSTQAVVGSGPVAPVLKVTPKATQGHLRRNTAITIQRFSKQTTEPLFSVVNLKSRFGFSRMPWVCYLKYPQGTDVREMYEVLTVTLCLRGTILDSRPISMSVYTLRSWASSITITLYFVNKKSCKVKTQKAKTEFHLVVKWKVIIFPCKAQGQLEYILKKM